MIWKNFNYRKKKKNCRNNKFKLKLPSIGSTYILMKESVDM